MSERRYLDVSGLEPHAYGHRALLWWGNLLLIVIEATMFGLVIAAYFYIRNSYVHWPPASNADPDLLVPTVNAILIFLSLIPEGAVHYLAVTNRSQRAIQVWLVISIFMLVIIITLRFFEFNSLRVRWDDNTYGSITWAALGLHLGHLFAALSETAILTVFTFTRELDPKHRLDLSVLAIYWYFVVAAWAVLYPLIFFGPRFL